MISPEQYVAAADTYAGTVSLAALVGAHAEGLGMLGKYAKALPDQVKAALEDHVQAVERLLKTMEAHADNH